MPQINSKFTVANVTANTFEIKNSSTDANSIDGTNFTPYKNGGTISSFDNVKQSLSAIPAGDAFSDLEDKVNSDDDVTVLLITKKVILEILAKLATKRRVGGFGQALKKTALDISRAAGVDV